MLATPNPPLPVLTRIVEIPVFTAGGDMHTDPGYHADSGLFHAPPSGFRLPKVPPKPSAEDLRQAKKLFFEDLLVDFPFVDASSLAHALALNLLPYGREMIEGPTPNHLVESPIPGSGKDLLVDCSLRPALGPHIGILAQTHDEEEWRKRITAALRQATPAILIGNLKKRLESGKLAVALTAPVWGDRILGKSEVRRFSVRCIWATTGNNPALSTEIARRSIRIRIDPKCPRPWERKDFKHPNLRQWVDEHRPRLVWAALTMIQAWILAGKPRWEEKILGSFEQWSGIMGGILAVNGVEGFLENLDELYETADSEESYWGLFVYRWWKEFGQKKVGVGELYPVAVDCAIDLAGETDHARKISLGSQLTQQRDRVVAGYRIVRAGKAQRAALWKLEVLETRKVSLVATK